MTTMNDANEAEFLRFTVQHLHARLEEGFASAGRQTDEEVKRQILQLSGQPGLFSDTPTDQDALGFHRWVQTEVALLRDPRLQTPSCLCITGPWGSGKSSFLRMISNILGYDDHEGWLRVWIDPAIFANPSEVIPFVAEETLRLAKERATKVMQDPRWVPYRDPQGKTAPPELVQRAKQDAREWQEGWSHSKKPEWDTSEFTNLLCGIRHALLGRQGLGKIIFFIDDLDRCEPGVVLEILRMHRALLNQVGVVLVYAMEYNMVAHMVGECTIAKIPMATMFEPEATYAAWNWGLVYLEKFFGRRIRIPEPDYASIQAWLDAMFGAMRLPDGLGRALWWGLHANPRHIKSFVNVCGYLIRGLQAAKDSDTLWEPLRQLHSDEAAGLLCKTMALAMGWPGVYDVVRVTGAEALFTHEYAVRRGQPITRLRYGDLRQEQADEGLIALLRSEPSFRQASAVLHSLRDACELYLNPSSYRYGQSVIVPPIVPPTPQQPEEGAKADSVSPADILRVTSIISQWKRELSLPASLADTLAQVPPPREGIELFRADGFRMRQPSPLVRRAADAFNRENKGLGQWFIAVAAVHPECDLTDFGVMESVLNAANEYGFLVDVMTLALSRLVEDERAQNQCLRVKISAMAETGDPDLQRQAYEESLRWLDLTPLDLEQEAPALPGNFDILDFEYTGDVLRRIEKPNENLKLCMAAARTEQGRSSSIVLTNLARALDKIGDATHVRLLYRAAIAASPEDKRAVYWYSQTFQSPTERTQRLLTRMALVHRDSETVDCWAMVGAALHDSGERQAATPWLARAVALAAPTDNKWRIALAENFNSLEGPGKAAQVLSGEYTPTPDYQRCLADAARAHEELIRQSIDGGKIEYEGMILFDPQALPAWLCETYPDLCKPHDPSP